MSHPKDGSYFINTELLVLKQLEQTYTRLIGQCFKIKCIHITISIYIDIVLVSIKKHTFLHAFISYPCRVFGLGMERNL